jgi:hypothetical protein
MVVSVALGLWFGRDTTYALDELYWLSTAPELDPETALRPYAGHLIVVTRLVYASVLDAFGAGYLPFRLLTTAALLLTAGLFFVFAKRRIGAHAALAPAVVLLFYGSDSLHVITGNGFTVLLALSAGIGALLALEREDRAGDVGACLLLFLALATYSVGLAFLAGAAILILIGPDRRQRAWVFLAPGVLYGAWLLWATTGPGSATESSIAISNLLLAPSWAFDSLAIVIPALIGLGYSFEREELGVLPETGWGPVAALAALAALGWRIWRGGATKWLWAMMAVPATLWLLHAAAALPGGDRVPENSRYVFGATIAVLLVAVEAARGLRLGRTAMLTLYAVAVLSLATNIALLRDGSRLVRARSDGNGTQMAAAEIAGGRLNPGFAALVATALGADAAQDIAMGYPEAVRRYGSPGFSPQVLPEQPESVREGVDKTLAGSLGIALDSSPGAPHQCHRVAGPADGGTRFEVPAGGAVLTAKRGAAELRLRRFATAFTVEMGELSPGVAAALSVPSDSVPDPWYAWTSAASLEICELPRSDRSPN